MATVRTDASRSSAVHLLAAASGAPLLPCSVWGTQRIPTRGRKLPDLRRPIDVHLRFGAAVDPIGHVALATRRLMAEIAALTAATHDGTVSAQAREFSA